MSIKISFGRQIASSVSPLENRDRVVHVYEPFSLKGDEPVCFYFYIGGIKKNVTADDGLVASKKLQQEVIKIDAGLSETDRNLTILVVNRPNDSEHDRLMNGSVVFEVDQLLVIVYGSVLSKVLSKYPEASLRFDMRIFIREIGSFVLSGDLSSSRKWISSDIMNGLRRNLNISSSVRPFVSENLKKLPVSIPGESVCSEPFVMCSFKLEISLPQTVGITAAVGGVENITSTILAEGHYPDITLVANDGTELKCHKSFLSVHSDVFRARFSMKEEGDSSAESMRMEMEDMACDALVAFLDFLYSFKTQSAEGNPRIALELLKAGHKYNIKSLKEAMENLFFSWPTAWSHEDSVEFALELFIFVKAISELKYLETRAIQVLKTLSKELAKSPRYQKLFREEFSIAMELCSAFADAK